MTDYSGASPTESRILDNTLPQSALHFLNYGEDQALDVNGKKSFNTFVDAYINTPNRKVVLPANTAGEGDSFIELWQAGAERLDNAGPPLDDHLRRQALRAYANSLDEFGAQWAGFLSFQFTESIGFQYRSRVPDWQARLEQAVEQVRSSTYRIPAIRRFKSRVLADRVVPLRDGQTPHTIDGAYIGWQRSHDFDLSTLMVAYGLDWFRRGYSYSHTAGGAWCGWHELRKDAARDMASGSVSTIVKGEREVPWSSILSAYMDRELFPRNDAALIELLYNLRTHVQTDTTGFAESLRHAKQLEDPVQSKLRRQDAIIDALMKVGLNPQRIAYESTRQDKSSTKTVSMSGAAGMVIYFVGELVKMAARSDRGARSRFRFHRWCHPNTVWRSYEIPGLPPA